MKTEKEHEHSSSIRKGRQVFRTTTMQNAKDIGITLQVDEKDLKELNEIQEETIEASQEHHKFAWR